MRRDYDVFEKFPDGSTLWRACVCGRFAAQRKIQELAEHSENEFFTIDIQVDDFFSSGVTRVPGTPARAAAKG